MEPLQRLSEGLARKTSRRGLFGRSAELATSVLLGAAAGTLMRPGFAFAGGTACGNLTCPCDGCQSTGVCAKPCIFDTRYWASGCWVVNSQPPVTCCNCECQGLQGIGFCDCASDYHGEPANCPKK